MSKYMSVGTSNRLKEKLSKYMLDKMPDKTSRPCVR